MSDQEMDDQFDDEPNIEIERDDALLTFSKHEVDQEQESACVYCVSVSEKNFETLPHKLILSGGQDEFLRVWCLDPPSISIEPSSSQPKSEVHINQSGDQVDSGNQVEHQIYQIKFDDTVALSGWNQMHNHVFYGIDMAGNIKVYSVEFRDGSYHFECIFETELGIDATWACFHPSASFLVVGLDSGAVYWAESVNFGPAPSYFEKDEAENLHSQPVLSRCTQFP